MWVACHLTLEVTIRSIGSHPKLELAMALQTNARQSEFNCRLTGLTAKLAHGARRHARPRVSTVRVSLEIILGSCLTVWSVAPARAIVDCRCLSLYTKGYRSSDQADVA